MKIRQFRGQSEMVGFGLIIIIVSVLIVVFLSFSLNNRGNDDLTEDYEVTSFLQSSLGYTTNCTERRINYLSLEKVITRCIEGATCENGLNPCDIMEETFTDMIKTSWPIGGTFPSKGYELNVTSKGETVFTIFEGNRTLNKKGTSQPYAEGVRIIFATYD